MRYYSLILNTNKEEIKENARVNLREYRYDPVYVAVNNYMDKNMKNNMTFCVYREGENVVFSTFSFDEQYEQFIDVYDYLIGMLNEAFQIRKIAEKPEEITMYQFMEYISEAKRREYIYNLSGLLKSSKLWLYDYYRKADEFYFHFEEKIVSVKNKKKTWLFDECFKKELLKIESHENDSALNGNMVHYIISSRSVEAASTMTEALMQSLLVAKRISSKRMEIITEIEPDVYRHNNKFEEIIENNYGGVIVFDLSEKFGTDPTDYVMTGKYIERLVKKYRNHCLFVFTYNIDHPGFSYYLLPQLKKYVILVTLREGSGTRKEAVNFLKALIKDSEYAQYSDQAGEYMRLFPGDEFSQTDVLTAYEQFDSWCLNKNVFKAYDYDISKEFLLDRDENTGYST